MLLVRLGRRRSVGSVIVPSRITNQLKALQANPHVLHNKRPNLLSPISMVTSSVYELCAPFMPFTFGADFSGDEKDGTGSSPCSSRIPVSFKVAPVRLRMTSAHVCKKQLLI